MNFTGFKKIRIKSSQTSHILVILFQLAEFRKLVEGTDKDGKTVQLEDNWRPTQPLHSREIKISFVPEDEYEYIKDKRKEYQQGASTDNSASIVQSLIFVPISLLCLELVV